MGTCLIYQPVGLGDILWLQPIVDKYIDLGYHVWYPVEDIYRDLLQEYMPKPNLKWVDPKSSFPMRELYGYHSNVELESQLSPDKYLAASFADRHVPHASVMMSKYYYLGYPLVNWHRHVPIRRNYDRENALLHTYNLAGKSFVLANQNYGTFPNYSTRNLGLGYKDVHYMNIEEDIRNGFHIFDWIGAIEKAAEIHSVETSICYLVDMYNTSGKIHMYEKRTEHEPSNFYHNINMVYRNPNWIYHVE